MRASFVPALGRNTSNNESMIRNPTAEEDNLMAVSTLQAAQRRRGLIPITLLGPRPAIHRTPRPAGSGCQEVATIPTIGWLSGEPPWDPWNTASP